MTRKGGPGRQTKIVEPDLAGFGANIFSIQGAAMAYARRESRER